MLCCNALHDVRLNRRWVRGNSWCRFPNYKMALSVTY